MRFQLILISMNYVFGALVDASGRAELYATTDRSIDPDRLVCRNQISILKVSTPNLLIVRDPFVSLLRAPMPWLEHWWMPRAGLSFMALQTDRSIPIDPDRSRSIGLKLLAGSSAVSLQVHKTLWTSLSFAAICNIVQTT